MSLDSESDGVSGGGAVSGGSTGSNPAADNGPEACELVTLATLYDPMEAEIIVAKLHSANIDAYLRHEAASTVIGVTFDGVARQDIIVRAEDLPEAQAALEQGP